MTIRLGLSAYRGVGLRIVGLEEGRFCYEVKLVHRDADLSVLLAEAKDEAVSTAQWREWVSFLGLQAFVERMASAEVQVNIDGVDLARRLPSARRRSGAGMARRPRFLCRRKVGRPVRAAAVGAGPRVPIDGPIFDP